MNKPLALLITGLAISSAAPAVAAAYSSSADMAARQQMVQSATYHGVDTSGARATAFQDAQNVALSRQFAKPTLAERHTEVAVATIYPQAGPSMAALAAKNTAVSLAMAPQTQYLGSRQAERRMAEEATP